MDLRLRQRRRLTRAIREAVAPTGPTAARLQPTHTPASGTAPLTVLSANLWHDWPRARRLRGRLEAFARLVEEERVDVVLLQEVMRASALHADEWLADRLGMAYVYARANGHRDGIGFEEGVAVFSRFPLACPRAQALGSGRGRFIRRLALAVRVDTTATPFWAFSVHLGLQPRHNAEQLRHLRAWAEEVAGPRMAMIGGDFNAPEGRPQIAETQRAWLDLFRELHPSTEAFTFERRWPWGAPLIRRRLDYVFLRPGGERWRPLDARHLEAPGGGHSDHRAVLVRLAPE